MATKPLPKLQFPQCAKRHINVPPLDAYTSPMVQVIVGEGTGERTFNIYKGLLTFHSEYFRTALKNCWKEGQTNTIRLPDEDSQVFQAFHYWLFSKRLHHHNVTIKDQPDYVEEISLTYPQILNIYFFADRRGSPGLANSALDVLFAKICQLWEYSNTDLKVIYQNTMEGSALRRYVVDDLLATYPFSDFREGSHLWPKKLLIEVICTAYEKQIDILNPTRMQSQETYTMEVKRTFCEKYHDHSPTTKEEKKELS